MLYFYSECLRSADIEVRDGPHAAHAHCILVLALCMVIGCEEIWLVPNNHLYGSDTCCLRLESRENFFTWQPQIAKLRTRPRLLKGVLWITYILSQLNMSSHASNGLTEDVDHNVSALDRLCQVPYHFSFPSLDSPNIAQDAELVDVTFPGPEKSSRTERIRFHDYQAIYAHPGLYESLFHHQLECQSPQKLVSLLGQCIPSSTEQPLNVLEIGAGNGIVAEELRLRLGTVIGRLVGTDLFPEARDAVMRDRPRVYDRYIVGDLLAQENEHWGLKSETFDALVVCAALGPGWGDLPIEAMLKAMKLLKDGAFVAITMNEKWLADGPSGNSLWDSLISDLKGGKGQTWNGLREVRRQHYRHRLDMRGNWIWYFAVVFQKELMDSRSTC